MSGYRAEPVANPDRAQTEDDDPLSPVIPALIGPLRTLGRELLEVLVDSVLCWTTRDPNGQSFLHMLITRLGHPN